MELADKQLNDYIDRVLFFGPDDKKAYQDQIDNLKTTLTKAINDNLTLRVTKINQAGSWRKGTALKPVAGQDVDIDLVVYLDVEDASASQVEQMHSLIIGLLQKAYPTKPKEDFTPNPKTVGIEFRTSGLLVDLVPAVPVKDRDGYVWQPERGGGGTFQTSPEGQLEFIRKAKDDDPRFTQLVRLAKRWRNYAELDGISSFALELIVAHVNRVQKPAVSINAGFLGFLFYLAQSQLKEAISFPGAINKVSAIATPMRIFDPTNNENNVTARTTEVERVAICNAAMTALQAINHALSNGRKGETETLWQSVLGNQFTL